MLADEVLAAQLDRVHADGFGELVELDLERETRLHAAMAALGAARGLVGVDARRIEAVRAERVRRGEQLARVVRGHETERRVRAAVQQQPAIHCFDPAVLRAAELVVHLHGVAAAVRIEDFFARVEQLDGLAGLHAQLGDDELEVERLALAAECAANGRLHHADARDIEVEHAGELALQVVRHLRRAPYRELAGRVVPADRTVRLDRRVRGALEEIIALDHDVARGECGIDVAERELHHLRDVAVVAWLAGLVDLRRVRLERVLGLEDRFQQFVLDADPAECGVRGLFVDGRDRCDTVADVAHAIDAERALVAGPRDDAVRRRHLGTGDDGAHAWHRLGSARVDRDDARVRVR